jgi:LAO/AO transport system kinase
VVNKADQPGVERAVSALKAMLGLGHPAAHHMLHHGQLLAVQDQADTPAVTDWQIPVLKTSATQNEGIDAVINALEQHHNHLHDSGEIARRNRTRLLRALEINLQSELLTRLLQQLPPETINHTLDQLTNRKLAPHAAAKALVDSVLK